MIRIYCDSQRVTDDVFKHWYGIDDKKLDELKRIGLSVGFFSMKVADQRIKFYVKSSQKNHNSRLYSENSKPELVINKRQGKRKFVFDKCKKSKGRPKTFKLIFKIGGIDYTLNEVCYDIGISDYHLKKHVRGYDYCEINGIPVVILRKPTNKAYYNLININNINKEFLNQTTNEAQKILRCDLSKLAALGRGYNKAKINGYQVIRHNGEER